MQIVFHGNSIVNWFVYAVRCADDSIYIGATNDVDARVKTHNSGKGSKYVARRLPVVLIGLIKFTGDTAKSEAFKFEYKLKQMIRQEKIAYIDKHFTLNYF